MDLNNKSRKELLGLKQRYLKTISDHEKKLKRYEQIADDADTKSEQLEEYLKARWKDVAEINSALDGRR